MGAKLVLCSTTVASTGMVIWPVKMAWTDIRSLAQLFLSIVYRCSHCLWGLWARPLRCCAVLCVLSSFAIIMLGKRELVTAFVVFWMSGSKPH